MKTPVPGQPPVTFSSFYPEFADYYADCEMETKAWMVRHVQPDWICMDVGANIGYFTLLLSRLAPQGHVIAFEPTKTAALLRANIEENSCGNVTVETAAVGNRPGRLPGAIIRMWGAKPETGLYDFTTLDAYGRAHDIQRLDLVKIDVDSYELDVLQGAEETLHRFDPYIICEFNNPALIKRNTDTLQLQNWLRARGYDRALVLDRENMLLKRNWPTGQAPDAPAFSYHYPAPAVAIDDRPLYGSASQQDLAGVLTGALECHSGTRLQRTDDGAGPPRLPHMLFTTTGERQTNAVILPVQADALATLPPGAALYAEITLRVLAGRISACAISADDRFVSPVRALAAAAEPQTLILPIQDAARWHRLLFRNIDDNFMPSRFIIQSLRIFYS